MTQATLRPTLAALALIAALWCAPDAGARGMRAAYPSGVVRPAPAVGDNVTTPLCEGFHLGNSLDAREVAPGRPLWLSRDPLGEAGGLNLYGFVGNDPVNKVDYLGLDDRQVDGGIVFWEVERKAFHKGGLARFFGRIVTKDPRVFMIPIGIEKGTNVRLLDEFGGGLVSNSDLDDLIGDRWLLSTEEYQDFFDSDQWHDGVAEQTLLRGLIGSGISGLENIYEQPSGVGDFVNGAHRLLNDPRIDQRYVTLDREGLEEAGAMGHTIGAETNQLVQAAGGEVLVASSGGVVIYKVGAKLFTMSANAWRARHAVGQSSRFLQIPQRTLQKVFGKHGSDFGLKGNWNPSRATEVSAAINQHINSKAVRQITGRYLGNPVKHFVDPKSRLNVITDAGGNFVGAWRLSVEQLKGVLSTGRLF